MFDEVTTGQGGFLTGLLTSTFKRWVDAVNRARTNAYTIDDFFEDYRAQFVDTWDTWNQIMGLQVSNLLPTVTIHKKWNLMDQASGQAMAHRRLTDLEFFRMDLEIVGGGSRIAKADYDVSVIGDFDGSVLVEINVNVPDPGAEPAVYRGMVLTRRPGGSVYEPLAWVVVVAEP